MPKLFEFLCKSGSIVTKIGDLCISSQNKGFTEGPRRSKKDSSPARGELGRARVVHSNTLGKAAAPEI